MKKVIKLYKSRVLCKSCENIFFQYWPGENSSVDFVECGKCGVVKWVSTQDSYWSDISKLLHKHKPLGDSNEMIFNNLFNSVIKPCVCGGVLGLRLVANGDWAPQSCPKCRKGNANNGSLEILTSNVSDLVDVEVNEVEYKPNVNLEMLFKEFGV
jgi:hypothetical protein